MRRFFLHIRTGAELVTDDEGADFVDLAAAMREAVRGARSLMSSEVLEGTLRLDQAIEIHDADDRRVGLVSFPDVLLIERGATDGGARLNDGASGFGSTTYNGFSAE